MLPLVSTPVIRRRLPSRLRPATRAPRVARTQGGRPGSRSAARVSTSPCSGSSSFSAVILPSTCKVSPIFTGCLKTASPTRRSATTRSGSSGRRPTAKESTSSPCAICSPKREPAAHSGRRAAGEQSPVRSANWRMSGSAPSGRRLEPVAHRELAKGARTGERQPLPCRLGVISSCSTGTDSAERRWPSRRARAGAKTLAERAQELAGGAPGGPPRRGGSRPRRSSSARS